MYGSIFDLVLRKDHFYNQVYEVVNPIKCTFGYSTGSCISRLHT